MNRTSLYPSLLFAATLPGTTPQTLAGETSKDIVAVEVRKQGHPCDTPKVAKRDESASQPNETVWMLTCDNATYRVRLVPNMASQIEKVDSSDKN